MERRRAVNDQTSVLSAEQLEFFRERLRRSGKSGISKYDLYRALGQGKISLPIAQLDVIMDNLKDRGLVVELENGNWTASHRFIYATS
jgi:hypothetical protein